MGSDAFVYVFDHARFVSEVVPAILALLRTGELRPILGALIPWHLPWLGEGEGTWGDWGPFGGADLARDCTYLRATELAFEGPVADSWWDGWEERACRSSECPSGTRCPYHIQQDGPDRQVDVVSELFEHAVARHCLSQDEGQFVGRSVNSGYYRDLLDRYTARQSDAIRRLLHALGTRGRVTAYGFANSDGIHGWLDPIETRALHTALGALDLLKTEPSDSFEAMRALHSSYNAATTPPQFHGAPWTEAALGRLRFVTPHVAVLEEAPHDLPCTWEELSLSFVRGVAAIAVRSGKGILWGNDLDSDHFRKP
jgi:hypothetical protein